MLDRETIKGIIKSLGLVFGDIGTSPIYTWQSFYDDDTYRKSCPWYPFTYHMDTYHRVSTEYAWLAMSLGRKRRRNNSSSWDPYPHAKSGRQIGFVTLLSFIGISLLLGWRNYAGHKHTQRCRGILIDTGLKEHRRILSYYSSIYCCSIIHIPEKGTEKVAKAFGPLMLIWFLFLAVSGSFQ